MGEKKKVRVLIYDIETTQFDSGRNDIPIDIIGYSGFDLVFESEKDLEREDFRFEMVDCPSDWQGFEVTQLVSRNVDEEIENLYKFCKVVEGFDVVSGIIFWVLIISRCMGGLTGF